MDSERHIPDPCLTVQVIQDMTIKLRRSNLPKVIRGSHQIILKLGCLRNFEYSKFRIFRMFFKISYNIRK